MLLYKYRGGNNEIFERDLLALKRNYFWSSSVNKLNDPCEALITSDKFEKQSNSLKFLLGEKIEGKFTNVKEALENLLELNKKIGVFSLSRRYNDELLWAHYGFSHKGFCIEYDLEIIKNGYRNEGYSFPVKYSNKPPSINFNDILPKKNQLIKKMIGFKSKRWKYEKEYRIITDFAGEYFYPPNAVRAIYFGVRTSEKNKEKIIKVLDGRGIKFYQIVQENKSYHFERKLLEGYNQEITFMKKFQFGDKQIKLELLDTKYVDLIKRADISMRIYETIKKEDIIKLSKHLQVYLFFKSKSLFIQIYHQHQKNKNICWASSFFRNGKWEIEINEFTM